MSTKSKKVQFDSIKIITHGDSLSILNYESYHYALSREMAQGA